MRVPVIKKEQKDLSHKMCDDGTERRSEPEDTMGNLRQSLNKQTNKSIENK